MKHLLYILLILAFSVPLSAQKANISELEKRDDLKVYLFNEQETYTGECVGYFPNGQLGKHGLYRDGLMEGKWTWWYSNGKKKRVSFYIKGTKNGSTIIWYDNGQKMSELMYDNGRMADKAMWWYNNGNRKKLSVYKDGKFWASVKWDDEGNKVLSNKLK